MPNTEPVVDSAAVLGALVETAGAEAEVPVGFLAAITKGQEGAELTEMAELADAGAAGFSDDGRPVVSAGLMRRALQYGAVAGRQLALHCEEPTLSRGGQMHEGVVSAELGFGGLPVGRRERDGRARPRPRRVRAAAAPPPPPLRARVGGGARARRPGRRGDRRGDAAPPLPDGRGGPLARREREDEPASPSKDDRAALVEGSAMARSSPIATDHAPHARHEKEVPFEARRSA